MNLPNKLTVIRMCMIPVFLLFYLWNGLPAHYFLAFLVFAFAAVTDMLDGKIARKYNLVTDFGKLMDPLADKLIVTAALCCILPEYGVNGIVSLVIILSREFLVTSVRLVAAGKGEVLAADIWGKLKTTVQMVWICLDLLTRVHVPFVDYTIEDLRTIITVVTGIWGVLFFAMVVLTVASGVHYVIKNRQLFADA